MNDISDRVYVIDSHTAGEPTRVILEGGPDLGAGSLADRCTQFREQFDSFRSAVVNEPRGSDVVVGALLCEPVNPSCAAGVLFFNNVGTLGMCGHGTMGLVTTLAHLGRISVGAHRIETPVGIVSAILNQDGSVTIENIPSFRFRKDVTVEVNNLGPITGDIAWGGNWFFLVGHHQEELSLAHVRRLTDVTTQIRQALTIQGITGADGAEIDHIELFGPPQSPKAESRNFVLCPGGAYDRSPCGTGTSAKLACLAADGQLRPGQRWRQEGILGSQFVGSFEPCGEGQILPRITGTAYVTAETTLLFDSKDPFRQGIRP